MNLATRLARIGLMVAALLGGYFFGLLLPLAAPEYVEAGEQTIHKEKSEAVVTLVDADRSDPSLFRWVLVVSLDAASSTLVDRDRGRVLVCVGRARTNEIHYVDGVPRLSVGECAEVFGGVVKPRER